MSALVDALKSAADEYEDAARYCTLADYREGWEAAAASARALVQRAAELERFAYELFERHAKAGIVECESLLIAFGDGPLLAPYQVGAMMEGLDFERVCTGGNCEGWRFSFGDGSHVIVACNSVAFADPASLHWIAGRFDSEGGHLADSAEMTLDALLNWLTQDWIK